MTNLDNAVNTFFENAGGTDFLGLCFGFVIIIAILIALVRPFDL